MTDKLRLVTISETTLFSRVVTCADTPADMVAKFTVIYRRPHTKKLLVTCCFSFGSTVIPMHLDKPEHLTKSITAFC